MHLPFNGRKLTEKTVFLHNTNVSAVINVECPMLIRCKKRIIATI